MLCKAETSTTMMSSLISRLVRSIVKYSYLWWHFLLNIIKPFEIEARFESISVYAFMCSIGATLWSVTESNKALQTTKLASPKFCPTVVAKHLPFTFYYI